MLTKSPIRAFLATANVDKALRFYRDTLGLELIADEPYALVFDSNGVRLRVQKVQEVRPAPYTSLGWAVTDIEKAVAELSDRGIVFQIYEGFGQDDRGIMTFPNGAKVAWFKDPDGNLLSLDES
jgi:catechol 2,3-dioxygenase-like lactoylglutathione lyase family enzyme